MEDATSKANSRVSFVNEPKLSEHEVDKKFNERRVALLPLVKDYIRNHSRFQNQDVRVTFAHLGVSSLISIIEMPTEKLVLKIPLSLTYAEGESHFLQVWEAAGVKVPHIYESGRLGDHSYALMEFINAPLLSDAYTGGELIKKGKYKEMGQTLNLMHTPRIHGYGRSIEGKPEFDSFTEWAHSSDMQKRAKYIEEHNLWSSQYGTLNQAITILSEYISHDGESSYCHDDFTTKNIFATEPMTIFDSNPRFNNRYIDIGRSLINYLDKEEIIEQFLGGYFQDEACDRKVLHASILVSIYIKLPYAHQTKSDKRIQGFVDYLSKNKHLLV